MPSYATISLVCHNDGGTRTLPLGCQPCGTTDDDDVPYDDDGDDDGDDDDRDEDEDGMDMGA